MSKIVKICKGLGYTLVAYIAVDAAWRAATGKGFSELLGPAAFDLLAWAGLIKQKAAVQIQHLTGSTQAAYDHFNAGQAGVIKDLLSKIREGDQAGLKALAEKAAAAGSEYLAVLNALPQKVKEIMAGSGFVADAANNLKLAGLASAALLLKTLHFFYKLGRKGKGVIKKKSGERTPRDLTGVFVSTDIHSEYRYHAGDNPFKIGSEKAREALNSLAASRLQHEIEVERNEEVQICWLVPGKASFRLDIDGKTAANEKVAEDHFYVGLKDKKFPHAGEYLIKLTIVANEASTVYTAKVKVIGS